MYFTLVIVAHHICNDQVLGVLSTISMKSTYVNCLAVLTTKYYYSRPSQLFNCILSSKHLSPCKRPPPFLMILWFTYVCVIHTDGFSV